MFLAFGATFPLVAFKIMMPSLACQWSAPAQPGPGTAARPGPNKAARAVVSFTQLSAALSNSRCPGFIADFLRVPWPAHSGSDSEEGKQRALPRAVPKSFN